MEKDGKIPSGSPPRGKGKPFEMTLTEEQKKTVKAVFGKYDLGRLTKEQARAIFQSLEEKGIRGPGVRAAVKESGIEPDAFWSLAHDEQTFPASPDGSRRMAPPPPGNGHHPPPPDGKRPDFPEWGSGTDSKRSNS